MSGGRGMRNRIAHGYFDVVWETVGTALPALLKDLTASPDTTAVTPGGNYE